VFKITILDHNFTLLQNIPPEVANLLSYKSKKFNPRTKKMKVETHSLIDPIHSTTYTGLVDYICDNFPVKEIEDQRTFPNTHLNEPNLTVKLRSYQIDYLIAALKDRRLIANSEGGSGKTTIIAALLDSLDLPTLIIAPNKTILAQLYTELKKLLPHRDFGIGSEGKVDLKYAQIIGTPQTLGKLPIEELRRFQVVMVDEAHTAAANSIHDLILSTNAPYRYGFTASPEGRSDNRDLVCQGVLGKVVKLIDRQELVDKGFLADITVELRRGAWNGNYAVLEDLLIVNNPLRNQMIYDIVKDYKQSSILVLVRRIEHGKILEQNIKGSLFLDGSSEAEDRERIREAMKAGNIRVLIATKIFGAGLDIPNLEVAINARGGKSDIETIQGSARLNRPWKEIAKTWIDIYDTWHPTLEKHSRERFEIYKNQGINIRFIGFPPSLEVILRQI
jgi:superfamily II DNA or RNA helicase